MVFNSDADGQDLCTLADSKAGSNVLQFPLKKKALYANLGVKRIIAAIWKAYGGWIYDDPGNTDTPEATGTLTASQRLYQFPTFTTSGGGTPEVQDMFGAEWKDASGSWNKLTPITLEDIKARGFAETEFEKTPGNPKYYRPIGGGFCLYPASDTTRAVALKIQVSRIKTVFASTSTVATPPFDSIAHEPVGIFMALQYAKDNTLAVAAGLQADWEEALGSERLGTTGWIQSHYASKFREMNPPNVKHRRDFAGQFE